MRLTKKYRWVKKLNIKMNSQIFEEIIGEFSPSLREDKTFQSTKHWTTIKDVSVSDYIKNKHLNCKNIKKWNRKIFEINMVKSYILDI